MVFGSEMRSAPASCGIWNSVWLVEIWVMVFGDCNGRYEDNVGVPLEKGYEKRGNSY